MNSVLLISDAAKQVNVEAHVLRYWEEELGLPIKRNELGHRYYTEEDVKRFQEIKELKERGLQLKAIRIVLKNGKLDMLSTGQVVSDTEIAEEEAAGMLTQKKGTANAEKMREKAEKSVAVRISETEPVLWEDIESVGGVNLQTQEDNREVIPETQAEKMQRLQWLLQQLFKETLKENNEYLCREVKDGIIKELDYQFRMQEEREEERTADKVKRDEEHFKRLDELIRKKRRMPKK